MKHGNLIDIIGFLRIYKQVNNQGNLVVRYVDSTSEGYSDYFQEIYNSGRFPELTTLFLKQRIEQEGY